MGAVLRLCLDHIISDIVIVTIVDSTGSVVTSLRLLVYALVKPTNLETKDCLDSNSVVVVPLTNEHSLLGRDTMGLVN